MISLIRWLSASLLSKWAWGKGYYCYSKVCVLRWPSQWNRPGMKITKTEDKRDDFSDCQRPFHYQQYSSMTSADVLSVLPFTDSDYPIGIFTLFPLKQIMYSQTATVTNGHIRQVVAKYRFISYEMHCKRNQKLRPRNTSYCLIEVVTKASLTVT